jgi:hypothetical protein
MTRKKKAAKGGLLGSVTAPPAPVAIVARIVGIVAMMVVAVMIAVVAMMVVVMMIAVPRCGWNRAAGRDCANNT